MEGSCEYIEQAVVDSLQGVVLQVGSWRGANNSSPKKIACYEMLYRDLDGSENLKERDDPEDLGVDG
jgi:hypothetical protein